MPGPVATASTAHDRGFVGIPGLAVGRRTARWASRVQGQVDSCILPQPGRLDIPHAKRRQQADWSAGLKKDTPRLEVQPERASNGRPSEDASIRRFSRVT